VHGSDINVQPWLNRGNRRATKWALAKVDRLFSVSQALTNRIHELAKDRKVDLVHNGADPECFQTTPKTEARVSLGLPSAGKMVLFVGNLIPIKNVAVLLDAVAKLSNKDVVLCLVGDGVLRESLRNTAAELGILDRCIFAGRRAHEEIPLWLSAADCLVIPSRMEGFPTMLPEAMLCRTPIIATAVGGIPEVVTDGVTGLLVKPDDAGGLAQSLERALHDSGFSAALAERAARFARENLTWEANARHVVAVYEDMLHASRRPRKPVSSCVPVPRPRV
jgi:glycosyltransferase involved in cell wall biosynthesis